MARCKAKAWQILSSGVSMDIFTCCFYSLWHAKFKLPYLCSFPGSIFFIPVLLIQRRTPKLLQVFLRQTFDTPPLWTPHPILYKQLITRHRNPVYPSKRNIWITPSIFHLPYLTQYPIPTQTSARTHILHSRPHTVLPTPLALRSITPHFTPHTRLTPNSSL